MAVKLKLDADGKEVVQDGKPVYVHDDGKEVAFDYEGTLATIGRLNAEAKGHREAKEAAESKLKGFEGITDPGEAIKALGIVKNLDQKKLIDAGEVDKIKQEAIKAVEEKYAPVLKEKETLQAQLHNEIVGGNFARSKFIADKLAIPADLVQARFGQAFKVEEGKLVAYDHTGQKIFSRARPGEVADFDEALGSLVDMYPHKDHILKGSGGKGGGSQGGGGQSGGSKTMNRTQFESLTPAEQKAHIKGGGTLVDA